MSDITTIVPLEELLPQLLTWGDYVAVLSKLQKIDGMINWYRADILLSAIERFGVASLTELAQIVNLPLPTITSLVRTSRAFPVGKRRLSVPFSLHLQASLIDSYNEKTKEFSGEKRFDLIERAESEMLSYREIARIVRDEKEKKMIVASGGNRAICAYCGKSKGGLYDYLICPRGASKGGNGYNFRMHPSCYEDYIALLKQKWNQYGYG